MSIVAVVVDSHCLEKTQQNPTAASNKYITDRQCRLHTFGFFFVVTIFVVVAVIDSGAVRMMIMMMIVVVMDLLLLLLPGR